MDVNFVYFERVSYSEYEYLVCKIALDVLVSLDLGVQGFQDLKGLALKSRGVLKAKVTPEMCPNAPLTQALFKYAEMFNNIGIKKLDYGYVAGETRAPMSVKTENLEVASLTTDNYTALYLMELVIDKNALPNLNEMREALRSCQKHIRPSLFSKSNFDHRVENGQTIAVVDNGSEIDNVIYIKNQPFFF